MRMEFDRITRIWFDVRMRMQFDADENTEQPTAVSIHV